MRNVAKKMWKNGRIGSGFGGCAQGRQNHPALLPFLLPSRKLSGNVLKISSYSMIKKRDVKSGASKPVSHKANIVLKKNNHLRSLVLMASARRRFWKLSLRARRRGIEIAEGDSATVIIGKIFLPLILQKTRSKKP